jgi:hypothetical protein
MLARETETQRGLRRMTYAILLGAAFLVVGLLVAWFALRFVETFPLGDPAAFDPTDLAPLGALVASALALLAVGILTLVFFFLALLALHRGKGEFGPGHRRNVDRAVLALVAVLVVDVFGGAVVSLFALGSSFPGLGVPRVGLAAIAADAATSLVGSLFLALFLLWCVERFVPPEGRKVLLAAVVLFVVAPATNALASAAMVTGGLAADALSPVWLGPMALEVLVGLVGLFLFWLTYRDALGRLGRGEIAPPLWTAPPPFPWPPPPPPED